MFSWFLGDLKHTHRVRLDPSVETAFNRVQSNFAQHATALVNEIGKNGKEIILTSDAVAQRFINMTARSTMEVVDTGGNTLCKVVTASADEMNRVLTHARGECIKVTNHSFDRAEALVASIGEEVLQQYLTGLEFAMDRYSEALQQLERVATRLFVRLGILAIVFLIAYPPLSKFAQLAFASLESLNPSYLISQVIAARGYDFGIGFLFFFNLYTYSMVSTKQTKATPLPMEFKPVVSYELPIGAVFAFAGELTNGALRLGSQVFLECNGAGLNSNEYSELFAVIKTIYGKGDIPTVDNNNNTHTDFSLPNYQGYFLRGCDPQSTVDVEAESRASANDPSKQSNTVGSIQADSIKTHAHAARDLGHAHGVNDPGHAHGIRRNYDARHPGGSGFESWHNTDESSSMYPKTIVASSQTGITIQTAHAKIEVDNAGGLETRPKNVAVYWLIRAK